ncbi:hypothetical protein BH09SUM1_BH09SUM1_14070 [soil metagenome]
MKTMRGFYSLIIPAIAIFSSAARDAHALAFGCEMATESAYEGVDYALAPTSGADLPDEKDLSPRLPHIGNQGDVPSCTSWALSYAKSYAEAEERNRFDYADYNTFNPYCLYSQLARGKCEGTSIQNGLNFLREYGSLTFEEFNRTGCPPSVYPFNSSVAAQNRISQFKRVTRNIGTISTNEIGDVTSWIAADSPVIVGCRIDQAFVDHQQTQQVYSNYDSSHYKGNHAMLVVGYNQPGRTVRLLNSWGETWGDRGLCDITFDAFRDMCFEGYVISQDIPGNSFMGRSAPPPTPTPQVTPTPIPLPIADGQPALVLANGYPYRVNVLLNWTDENGAWKDTSIMWVAEPGSTFRPEFDNASIQPHALSLLAYIDYAGTRTYVAGNAFTSYAGETSYPLTWPGVIGGGYPYFKVTLAPNTLVVGIPTY